MALGETVPPDARSSCLSPGITQCYICQATSESHYLKLILAIFQLSSLSLQAYLTATATLFYSIYWNTCAPDQSTGFSGRSTKNLTL